MQAPHEPSRGTFWTSRSGIALLAFFAIAGFYLVTEHTAHLFGALPYVLLLACLPMHFFMHGGHGGHSGDAHSSHQHDGSPPEKRRPDHE